MKIANYTPYREGWVDARKNPVNTLTRLGMYNSETERGHRRKIKLLVSERLVVLF